MSVAAAVAATRYAYAFTHRLLASSLLLHSLPAGRPVGCSVAVNGSALATVCTSAITTTTFPAATACPPPQRHHCPAAAERPGRHYPLLPGLAQGAGGPLRHPAPLLHGTRHALGLGGAAAAARPGRIPAPGVHRELNAYLAAEPCWVGPGTGARTRRSRQRLGHELRCRGRPAAAAEPERCIVCAHVHDAGGRAGGGGGHAAEDVCLGVAGGAGGEHGGLACIREHAGAAWQCWERERAAMMAAAGRLRV